MPFSRNFPAALDALLARFAPAALKSFRRPGGGGTHFWQRLQGEQQVLVHALAAIMLTAQSSLGNWAAGWLLPSKSRPGEQQANCWQPSQKELGE